jgi:hypothetical protein
VPAAHPPHLAFAVKNALKRPAAAARPKPAASAGWPPAQKDGQDGIRIGFEMVEIEISSSSLGFDPSVSLAVQASDEALNTNTKTTKGHAGNGKNQRLEMLCLETVVRSKGIIKFVDKKQRMAVNLEEWRQELWAKMGCTDEDKNTFKTAWSRAKTRLQDAGLIGIRDKLVWLESKDQSEDEY